MSNTPETDAIVSREIERGTSLGEGAIYDFARSLERRLAEYRCPIHLDDTPEICSAGSCLPCLGKRYKELIECAGEAEAKLAEVRNLCNDLLGCIYQSEEEATAAGDAVRKIVATISAAKEGHD